MIMCMRALTGNDKALESDYTSTLKKMVLHLLRVSGS